MRFGCTCGSSPQRFSVSCFTHLTMQLRKYGFYFNVKTRHMTMPILTLGISAIKK